jgi:uncharacterized protein involved in cysteine biosynthesis
MIRAFSRALSQLADPALLGVVLISALGAAAVLAASWFGVGAALAHFRLFETGWLDWLARIGAGVTALIATLALYGAIAALIASLMSERVARAVDRRFYPDLPPPRRQSAGEQVGTGLSFLGATILINLLALPLYWIWGANVIVFLIVNGYLLGREYFELVALRRLDRVMAARLRRAHPLRVTLGGMVIAALSFLPLANLLTPVFATAFMLHLFQGLPEFAGAWSEPSARRDQGAFRGNQGLSARPFR